MQSMLPLFYPPIETESQYQVRVERRADLIWPALISYLYVSYFLFVPLFRKNRQAAARCETVFDQCKLGTTQIKIICLAGKVKIDILLR